MAHTTQNTQQNPVLKNHKKRKKQIKEKEKGKEIRKLLYSTLKRKILRPDPQYTTEYQRHTVW